jgi:mRNA-degrading endonuclease RelE of RelBE toxin-antitoxin system
MTAQNTYRLLYAPKFKKPYKKLPRKLKTKVRSAVSAISTWPEKLPDKYRAEQKPSVKHRKGFNEVWTIKIDFHIRLTFAVREIDKKIALMYVGQREGYYDTVRKIFGKASVPRWLVE